jgi:hypothetical protein
MPSKNSEMPILATVKRVLRLLRRELLKVKGTYFHIDCIERLAHETATIAAGEVAQNPSKD